MERKLSKDILYLAAESIQTICALHKFICDKNYSRHSLDIFSLLGVIEIVHRSH